MRIFRRKATRRILLFAGGSVFSVCAALLLWMLLPCFVADPMPRIQRRTPARIYYDRRGAAFHAERTWDGEWRFDVTPAELPEHVVTTLLAVEDWNFFSHGGVDYAALLRAFFQNLSSGRIISGASTITMQLASMADGERRRSYSRKFFQILRARKLEQLYSKERILTEYINRIPFGGKIYGIEAAAEYYFGLPAANLNQAEASLLCGLPQKPNRFRPDRSLKNARMRQKLVLRALVRHGVMTETEAARIYGEEPLRLRDFSRPSPFAALAHTPYHHYCREAKREAGNSFRISTALDPELHALILNTLKKQCAALEGVHDGAAVLIENASGEIPVMIGTLDFHDPAGGQVNAARAVRSAGSALKPFLYAEALEGGLILKETRLDDSPLRRGDYTPGNYDGNYLGRVTAAYALSRSLNTPAVRLLARLGMERLEELFRELGLKAAKVDTGLSFALGTAGYSLVDLTNAYTVFPRDGAFRTGSFLHSADGARPQSHIFHPGSALMVTQMLQILPLPGSSCAGIAWKTGTSNNNCDAWCFAFTEDYTLGVWFGNKDGTSAPALVGGSAAAPCAGEIMSAIYRFRKPTVSPKAARWLKRIRICAESGLAASGVCAHTTEGEAIRSIPPAVCRRCGKTAGEIRIVSPLPGSYRTEGKTLRMKLAAENDREAHWYLDETYLGKFSEKHLEIPAGAHTLRARSGTRGSSIRFSVSEDAQDTRK